jgi:lipopolysaccharide/colanic/teichoic acid biosynthesis glycosyltransferase
VTTNPRTGIPRWVDAAAATIGLVVLTPVLAVVALGVRLSSAGPVLFRQARIGRAGRRFTMLKFRTMRADASGPQFTSKGDPRITAFGRLLRKTKLDELPELWNVVRGDMSIVGPRPEVPAYVDLRDPAWVEVLRCRPGITDPVTVALRSEEELIASIDEDRDSFYRLVLLPHKLEGYVDYSRRRTIASDVNVLWRTLVAICVPGVDDLPKRTPSRRELPAKESQS